MAWNSSFDRAKKSPDLNQARAMPFKMNRLKYFQIIVRLKMDNAQGIQNKHDRISWI